MSHSITLPSFMICYVSKKRVKHPGIRGWAKETQLFRFNTCPRSIESPFYGAACHKHICHFSLAKTTFCALNISVCSLFLANYKGSQVISFMATTSLLRRRKLLETCKSTTLNPNLTSDLTTNVTARQKNST